MTYITNQPYDEQSNKYVKIDPMREMSVMEPVKLCGTDFGGITKDTNFWTESMVGTGAATQAGQITLSTGATANSECEYKSVRNARYMAGSANFFRSVVRIPDAGVVNNVRRWGAFSSSARVPQNGAWFQINGATMGVAYVQNGGTPVVVTGTNGTAITQDNNAHTYEIWWTNSKIWYFQDDTVVHTVSAATGTWSYMGAFNATIQNINSGGLTTNVVMECRVASIFRFGKIESVATHKNITGAGATVCKVSAGRLHHIIFNNPTAKNCIIYDSAAATGTVIGTITPVATSSPFYLTYNVHFSNGLTVDTSAGSQDITIVYE